MKEYKEFHGEIAINDIGKRLRAIVAREQKSFVILTGYGSTSGVCKSKNAALKSLANMKREGLIKGFFPGEVKHKLLKNSDPFFQDKMQFELSVKNHPYYGNDGYIFVFL